MDVELNPQTQRVRAAAWGTTEMRARDLLHALDEDEAREIATTSLKATAAEVRLAGQTGGYYVFDLSGMVAVEHALSVGQSELAGCGSPGANPHLRGAVLQGLRDHGYVEGRNVVIENRSAEGKLDAVSESNRIWAQ